MSDTDWARARVLYLGLYRGLRRVGVTRDKARFLIRDSWRIARAEQGLPL